MRHACPASRPGKTIWAKVYYGFEAAEQRNVILVTGLICKEIA
jgi:hypothetical protein